jgi:hypothetical protein
MPERSDGLYLEIRCPETYQVNPFECYPIFRMCDPYSIAIDGKRLTVNMMPCGSTYTIRTSQYEGSFLAHQGRLYGTSRSYLRN